MEYIAVISIHALCEEGDLSFSSSNWASIAISIHALCEEGDFKLKTYLDVSVISIHALCEEGDSKNRDKISIFKQIIQHSARI